MIIPCQDSGAIIMVIIDSLAMLEDLMSMGICSQDMMHTMSMAMQDIDNHTIHTIPTEQACTIDIDFSLIFNFIYTNCSFMK